MNIEEIVIEAIKNKKKIIFNYKNEGVRKVAPHAVYFSGERIKKFDAFQFEGFSEQGGIPAWRQFFIDKITGIVEITSESFEICEGYRSDSERYFNVIYKI